MNGHNHAPSYGHAPVPPAMFAPEALGNRRPQAFFVTQREGKYSRTR